jgi:hypothetical protein
MIGRVSDFAQTQFANERRFRSQGALVVAMSESDQFRQYAEEAMVWVAQAKTEEEKQLLLELLCTWTAAAAAADAIPIANAPQHAGR